MRKPRKTVEIVLRVSVPGHWTAGYTRSQIKDNWWGAIDAYGPPDPAYRSAPSWWGKETTLRPRWGKARVVAKPTNDGGYLDRFPPEHRKSADRAYQDGFADGVKDSGGDDE